MDKWTFRLANAAFSLVHCLGYAWYLCAIMLKSAPGLAGLYVVLPTHKRVTDMIGTPLNSY